MKRTSLSRSTPLRRTSELRRSTPMPKAKKPLRQRNPKRRPAAFAIAQRQAVIERSGGRCEFEILTHLGWLRCGSIPWQYGIQVCHVIRRAQCGDAVYSPDVAIAGCKKCHDAFDHRSHPREWDRVRVPEVAVARAIAAVKRAEAARAAAGKAVVSLKGHPNV